MPDSFKSTASTSFNTSASSAVMEAALSGGCVTAIACFKADIKEGSPFLPRQQDLPHGALLSGSDAAALFETNPQRHAYSLSYGWRTASLPDPDGLTFASVVQFLEQEQRLRKKEHPVATRGLFWE